MKNSFNLKTMFTLFLAAPFLVLIAMIFIFMGLAENRSTTSNLLEAPKYMIGPILKIINNDFSYTGEAQGVLLLLDSTGDILYPVNSSISTHEFNLSLIYTDLIKSDLENISMTKFTYQGETGFCFFDNSYFPAVYKQHIRIGISLFIVLISSMGLIFGQVSTVIINSSIKRLVDASDLIANGNLDEKITLKYNNELIHVANAIDRMRIELREKRNMEQRFVMSVTHDLKTPLTSINGYLEAIADGVICEKEEILEIISLMQKKTFLLDNRINELLDYSRNTTAGWREQWRSINVLHWLNDISVMFHEDAHLYGRDYLSKINIHEDLVIKCNDKLLTRALENLFDNACRYSHDGDSIVFSAKLISIENKNKIEINIEDSGSGIEEEDFDKIFELFYRNDRGRNSRGMGIGLASVQTIVKDHGGQINCEKSEYGGAKFTIILDC
ncbi:MAG: HAMP domain-containing sensor histidine kinase [Spirochaetaceae bacterium]|jgi:signal transduction histidine kinase|nr:HAMP domain-containing sensor histidine kinase [Spirochaetaceae bacterium]